MSIYSKPVVKSVIIGSREVLDYNEISEPGEHGTGNR